MAAGVDLTISGGEPAHRAAVLELLAVSLGVEIDQRYREFLEWKHRQNPFGVSPEWVALDDGRVVGFRTFLRWEFERGGEVVRAVRAVDTATHPDYQGRGIFTQLTRHALEAVRAQGVAWVFNTPNDKSRPGYLKMGWQVVGRLPVAASPTSIGALRRMASARTPAELWSEESTAGIAAPEVLEDLDALRRLIASIPATDGIRTHVTPEFLQWRYGLPLLRYRAVLLGDDPARGLAIFRVRRRGPAREAALATVIASGGDASVVRALVRAVRRVVDADYVAGIGTGLGPRVGFAPLPRVGPILTWREVCDARMPALEEWRLELGDVELF